ncbi:MAG: flavodoxin, partial [Treponema sp.]|nr:flavodoxin [Treponema sp.]
PMWWYTMPMILYTFFESQNWNGKRVIPFNMHMGSRDGGTYKTVRELAKGAEVLEGLPLSMQTVESGAFSDQVKNWINGLGL